MIAKAFILAKDPYRIGAQILRDHRRSRYEGKLVTTPAPAATPGGPRRRKPPRRAEVVSVSPVSARLISVLVTGDDLDGFTDAAPTSHLKVFLPADGQDAPNLPTPGPDGTVAAPDGPAPVVRTYTPRRYDPATQDPGDPVPAARHRSRLRVGAAGEAGRQARGGRPGRPVLPRAGRRTTGGSPPTSPPSRPSARCSRRCRRRPRPTSTSRSTARTTRSSSPPRPRPRSPGTTVAARTRSASSSLDAARAASIPDGSPRLGGLRGGRDARHPPLLPHLAPPARRLPGNPGLLAHRRAEPPRPRLRRGLAQRSPTGRCGRRCARGAGRRGRSGGRTPRSCARAPRGARSSCRRAWCRGCPGRRPR